MRNAAQLAEQAVALKHAGYNCAQAVTAALRGETEMDEETLNRLAAGFGLGMGNMEGTCGSLVGAAMLAGLRTGGKGTMRLARQISEQVQRDSGAVVCKTLKGKTDSAIFCPCDDCVRNAVKAYCAVMDEAES